MVCPPTAQTGSNEHPMDEDRIKDLIIIHPDSASLYARLSLIKFAKGTVKGRVLAAKYMKLAVRADPQNTTYRLLLAEMHFRAQLWSNGVAELRNLLDIDPNHNVARCRLGKAYLEKAKEQWQYQ